MIHDNNAKIKLAKGACTGGVPTDLRRRDVFHEPKHPPPLTVTVGKYGLTKQHLF